MKNKGLTDNDIAYVKIHLREKIESYQLKHFKFVNVDNQKLIIFSVSLKTEDVLVRHYAKDKELETNRQKYLRCCDCYSGAAAKNRRCNTLVTTSERLD